MGHERYVVHDWFDDIRQIIESRCNQHPPWPVWEEETKLVEVVLGGVGAINVS